MTSRPFEVRFWEKVDKSGDCWVWTGATTLPGWYGRTFMDGRLIMAHRAAWIVEHGPIPEGKSVLHHCDNPPCVRASHLFLGTHTDNMRDAAAKGRMGQTRHKTACVHGHAYTPENTYRSPKTGHRQCATCRLKVSLERSIRHTAVTLGLEAGIALTTISERVGHSDYRTTKNVYGHITEALDRDAAARMERVMGGDR